MLKDSIRLLIHYLEFTDNKMENCSIVTSRDHSNKVTSMKFRSISQVVIATTIVISQLYFLPLSVQAFPFQQQTQFGGAITKPPGPASMNAAMKKNAYFIKRIGAHSEWLLTNSGRADLWNEIKSSAQRDARSTSSEFYHRRIAEHTEWFLPRSGLTSWWNDIYNSAARDAKL